MEREECFLNESQLVVDTTYSDRLIKHSELIYKGKGVVLYLKTDENTQDVLKCRLGNNEPIPYVGDSATPSFGNLYLPESGSALYFVVWKGTTVDSKITNCPKDVFIFQSEDNYTLDTYQVYTKDTLKNIVC